MTKCLVCNGNEFEVSAGARICKECGAHELNFLELEFGEEDDVGDAWSANPGKYLKVLNVQNRQGDVNIRTDTEIYMQNWSTFEALNIILLDWVKALRHIGASEKLKDFAFKLWVIYLNKRRIAFRSASEDPADLPQIGSEVLSIRDAKFIRNTNIVQCKAKRKRRIKDPISKLERAKRKVERNKLKNNVTQSPAVLAYLTDQLNSTLNTTNEQDVSDDDMVGEKSIFERSHLGDPSIHECNDEVEENITSATLDQEKEDKTNLNNPENIIKLNPSVSKIVLGEKVGLYNGKLQRDPTFFNIEKLVSLLYLAILLSGENILLSDFLRWCKEGHVPYFTAVNLLGDDFEMSRNEYETFFKVNLLTAHSCRDSAGILAHFLSVQHLPLPSIQIVMDRFIKALNLPIDVSSMAMKRAAQLVKEQHVRYTIPGIEVYCASLIILTLKIAFGLDGRQEYLLSEFAENFNEMMECNGKSFYQLSWCKWQSYINRLQWWLNDVNVARNHHINSFTSTDTHRLSQHFWTQGIWHDMSNNKDTINNWEIQLAENLLQIGESSLKDVLKQDSLFKPYFIPFTGQIKDYISEACKRDPSPRMQSCLQIAKELDTIDFSNHRTFMLGNEIEAKFKELEQNVKVFLVSLSDRERIFNIVHEEKKLKLTNDSTYYLLLPNPVKTFWIFKNEFEKTDEPSHILRGSNFMWLVNLFSELCETTEKDIICHYRKIERRYLSYFYNKEKQSVNNIL